MDSRPSWRSGSGREAFPKISPHKGPGVVGRSHQRSGSLWEALLKVRSGQEALAEVRERLGGPSGGLGVVGRPSERSGSGRELLPEV